MEYILFLTYRCNLNCRYCFAKNMVHNQQKNKATISKNDVQRLCEYIENDIVKNKRKDNSIVFFGGEPTLVPDIILDIMERTSHLNLNYSIYTNGLLLDKLPIILLEKLQSILVAIDGDKECHESFKPVGSYEKIISNVKKIKNKTSAQIIARITMEENSNIYNSVTNLLEDFDFVHWQIVNKQLFDNPDKLIKSYRVNISRLFEVWKTAISKGIILNIVPFNRIVNLLLTNEPLKSFKCGCGSTIQAIDVDGNIYLCDEYIEETSNALGNIRDEKYNLIYYKTHNDLYEECAHCEISSVCAGRCRKCLETQTKEQIKVYCELTKILVNTIVSSIDEIKEHVLKNNIDLKELATEIYKTEIIP